MLCGCGGLNPLWKGKGKVKEEKEGFQEEEARI